MNRTLAPHIGTSGSISSDRVAPPPRNIQVLVVFSAENVTKQAILVIAIDVDVPHIVSSLIIT